MSRDPQQVAGHLDRKQRLWLTNAKQGPYSIEKLQQLNRDPGSCAKQHFIDDGCVAGMTVSFCDFNLLETWVCKSLSPFVGVG